MLPLLLLFQLAQTPGYIPAWTPGPMHWCVDASAAAYREEIEFSIRVWSLASGLAFAETNDCRAPRTIAVSVGTAASGFLGLGMFPPPLSPEPVAGDVTLSPTAPWWTPDLKPLLVATLLHEMGHALGLPDSPEPEDLMAHVIHPGRFPGPRELRAVRCLYLGECK